jgi:Trk K+ transport system NAD-binding subunit
MANGWSFGDSLYMVVLTVFTVGFEEVRPVDTVTLRTITIVLIIIGCTGMIYLTGALVQFITYNQLQEILGTTRMNKQIEDLDKHVIICGYGRLGQMLAKELKEGKSEFVVLEPDVNRCKEAKEHGYLYINADATEESSLKTAGIERARALASVVSSDPINVFITLSARGLNKSIQIIARGEEPSTQKKLLQAGANSVVLPTHIGAEQIGSMILFPAIAGMIQSSERRRQMELDLRALGLEIEIVITAEGSVFAGRTVEEIEQRSEHTFFVIAIEKAGSGVAERPRPGTRIYPGDGVTVIGRGDRAGVLSKFSAPIIPISEGSAEPV